MTTTGPLSWFQRNHEYTEHVYLIVSPDDLKACRILCNHRCYLTCFLRLL